MAVVREKLCRSVLCKSGIAPYALNPYTGCLHRCIYCYARFMKRFSGHREPWGTFVDVKINAAEILAKEAKRKPKAEVVISSVCDGWQPLERKYQITRKCLQILVENQFPITVLTKSSLVTRDYDILTADSDIQVGFTITTLNQGLSDQIEPRASSSWERVRALEKAKQKGIRIWALLGPLMPALSDTEESLVELFRSLASLELDHIFVDKLNPRPGVWPSVFHFLKARHPGLVNHYRRVLFDGEESWRYREELRQRVKAISTFHGFDNKINLGF